MVVLAAGEGRRSGHRTNKVLLDLAGRPVFVWGLLAAAGVDGVRARVVVIRDQDRSAVLEALHRHVPDPDDVIVVEGGATRHDSEWRSVQALSSLIAAGEVDVVAIHDAARPLAPTELFERSIRAAARHGGAIPGRVEPGLVSRTDPRVVPAERLVSVQTPQCFRARPLLEAHRRAQDDGFEATDTAGCLERYTTEAEVTWVDSDALNLKITFPEDLNLAEALIRSRGG